MDLEFCDCRWKFQEDGTGEELQPGLFGFAYL